MSIPSQEEELKKREVQREQLNANISAAISEVEHAFLKNYPGFQRTIFPWNMGGVTIVCLFAKDEDLKRAEDEHFTETVQRAMRTALKKYGCPGFLFNRFPVCFTTDEDVKRTCDGDYWRYFK